jgi:hypothetical protein
MIATDKVVSPFLLRVCVATTLYHVISKKGLSNTLKEGVDGNDSSIKISLTNGKLWKRII